MNGFPTRIVEVGGTLGLYSPVHPPEGQSPPLTGDFPFSVVS